MFNWKKQHGALVRPHPWNLLVGRECATIASWPFPVARQLLTIASRVTFRAGDSCPAPPPLILWPARSRGVPGSSISDDLAGKARKLVNPLESLSLRYLLSPSWHRLTKKQAGGFTRSPARLGLRSPASPQSFARCRQRAAIRPRKSHADKDIFVPNIGREECGRSL